MIPNHTREKHGDSKTVLYSRWNSMWCRVSPTYKHRDHYYERGIGVCDEWKSYSAFKMWAINNGFSPELELDRENNDQGYSPQNCRWVPKLVNNSNRSVTIMVDYKGQYTSLTLLAQQQSWPQNKYKTIARRISNGWDVNEAIETPLKVGNYGHSGPIKIKDLITGVVYSSVNTAAKAYNVRPNKLSAMLNGRRRNNVPVEKL
jgi:hypothetical protein